MTNSPACDIYIPMFIPFSDGGSMPDSGDIRTERPSKLGFINEPVGTHNTYSISLDSIQRLFDATTPATPYEELSSLILVDNILGKQTQSARVNILRRLREYYSLHPEIPVYSGLRFFWDCINEEQPLLAILCAAARDPILRESAEVLLPLQTGDVLSKQVMEDRLRAVYPGRYSTIVQESMVRKLRSSWTQSGHLIGRSIKIRKHAVCGPASTAYALFLGYLTGLRGNALFSTIWVRILDATPSEVHQYAFEASKRGWIDYRRSGDVTEVGFSAVPGHETALQG